MTYQKTIDVLKKIIDRFGIEIYSDKDRLWGAIDDLADKDSDEQNVLNVLRIVVLLDVPAMIMRIETEAEKREVALNKAYTEMEKSGLSKEWCAASLYIMATPLSIDTTDIYPLSPADKQAKKENQNPYRRAWRIFFIFSMTVSCGIGFWVFWNQEVTSEYIMTLIFALLYVYVYGVILLSAEQKWKKSINLPEIGAIVLQFILIIDGYSLAATCVNNHNLLGSFLVPMTSLEPTSLLILSFSSKHRKNYRNAALWSWLAALDVSVLALFASALFYERGVYYNHNDIFLSGFPIAFSAFLIVYGVTLFWREDKENR